MMLENEVVAGGVPVRVVVMQVKIQWGLWCGAGLYSNNISLTLHHHLEEYVCVMQVTGLCSICNAIR